MSSQNLYTFTSFILCLLQITSHLFRCFWRQKKFFHLMDFYIYKLGRTREFHQIVDTPLNLSQLHSYILDQGIVSSQRHELSSLSPYCNCTSIWEAEWLDLKLFQFKRLDLWSSWKLEVSILRAFRHQTFEWGSALFRKPSESLPILIYRAHSQK